MKIFIPFDNTTYNEQNHFHRLSKAMRDVILRKEGFFEGVNSFSSIEKTIEFRINMKDHRIAVFNIELGDRPVVAWIRYQDILAIAYFVQHTCSKWFDFSYIIGTHSPYGNILGMLSNSKEAGYKISVTSKT